jgi:DNA-binding response OmpR family regulator
MILIVDDEPTSLLMLEMVLRRENAGAMVTGIVGAGGIRMAKSGKEAMAVLESAEGTCQLVITDIKMPGMDGKELLAAMRSVPSLSTIPVIMCTGVSDQRTVVEMLGQGVRDYILKPYDPDKVLSKVRAALTDDQPVIEMRANTVARLGIDDAGYTAVANAAVPALDAIAANLVQAVRVRNAKAARAVAERVDEPAAQFGARRCASAAHRVMDAESDLEVLRFSGVLVNEVGELRSALGRVGAARKM